jgi:hypothetical protein
MGHEYIHTYISFTFHQSNISPSAAGYETCHNITNININDRHRQETQTTVSQYDITQYKQYNTIQKCKKYIKVKGKK